MSETEDSRYQLLDNNAQAVRALMQAVEGKIGRASCRERV